MDIETTTLKAIIGLAGVIGGALIGGFFAAHNARQKLKEINIQHSHKLHENYLKNAREYISSVYVPISIEINKLTQAYYTYRKISAMESEKQAADSFREDIISYLEKVNELFSKGAGAFLTNELESKLLEFGSFLAESMSADKSIRRVVVYYGISLFGMSAFNHVEKRASGKSADFWQGNFGFSRLGVSMKFDGEVLLAAPLGSDEFIEHYSDVVNILNLLIKEVTLGSAPKAND